MSAEKSRELSFADKRLTGPRRDRAPRQNPRYQELVDYDLLWLKKYNEFLREGYSQIDAANLATRHCGPQP